MGKRVGRPSIPSSHPTKEPKYLPAPAYRHIAPQLLKIQFSGAGEKRERGGWASGGVSARSWREESSSEAKPRAPEGGLSRAEQLGCRQRANARTAGGGHRPLPHLAALLVMKADHRDVQYGPTGGAIAAAPVFLHGRPPQARKTMTATAESGKPSNPVIPRRTASSGFQVSARAPHESLAGSEEEAEAPAALHRPPRAAAELPSSASAASGLSPDAAADAGKAGLGRIGRHLMRRGLAGPGEGEGRRDGAGPGWVAWHTCPPLTPSRCELIPFPPPLSSFLPP